MGPKKCDSKEESLLRVERFSPLVRLESRAVRTGEEPEEHYKQNWWISLNKSGRSGPVKDRSDFNDALTSTL